MEEPVIVETPEVEIQDLIPASDPQMHAHSYKVTDQSGESRLLTVLAFTGTAARTAALEQFSGCAVTWIQTSDLIIQVNG